MPLPLHEIAYQYVWSTASMGRLLECGADSIRSHLYNAAGERVSASEFVEGDCWLVWCGLRIPVHKDHRGHPQFWRREVDAAFEAGGQVSTAKRFHPSVIRN